MIIRRYIKIFYCNRFRGEMFINVKGWVNMCIILWCTFRCRGIGVESREEIVRNDRILFWRIKYVCW